LHAPRELLDEGESPLKLILAALERRELVALGTQYAKQLLDLDLLRERDTS
jgi:hypothetical protein